MLKRILAVICVFLVTTTVGASTVDADGGYASSMYSYAGVLGDDLGETIPGYTLGNPVAISKDSQGYYYVADIAGNRILKLNSSFVCVDVLNGIDLPIFVYVDNNDYVLVNEMGTHKIKKYTTAFEFVQEWGGEGTEPGKFNIPRSIVQDSRGNYYVSDELNHRIQKFNANGEYISTYGSYGSANGQFAVQQGLSIDAQDRLYVADTYNNRIQVFRTYPEWQHLRSFGEYGIYQPFNYFSFQPGIMNHPRGVYVEKSTGRVAVSDSSNNRVMVYNSYESNFSFYQSQNGYLGMSLPAHAIMENNRLIVVDSHSRILKYSSVLNNTNLFVEYGTYRRGANQFSNPQSVCVNQSNGDVYISDSFNHRIQRFDENGNLLSSYGGIGGPYGYGTLLGYFAYPKQVSMDGNECLYVADYGNSRIVKKAPNSNTFALVATVANPWGVIPGNDNKLYVSSWGDNSVKVFRNGMLIATWYGTNTPEGGFSRPAELKIGRFQNQDALFIADCGNNVIQVLSLDGNYLGQLGASNIDPLGAYYDNKANGGMLLPYSVAIASNGNIIVGDSSHKCMRTYDSDGTLLETWAHMSNTPGNFFSPMGCDINHSTGRLYVTDGVCEKVQYFDRSQND